MSLLVQERPRAVNLGPRGRRRRRRAGLLGLAAAVGLQIALSVLGAPAGWAVGVGLLSAAGAAGILQAREKT